MSTRTGAIVSAIIIIAALAGAVFAIVEAVSVGERTLVPPLDDVPERSALASDTLPAATLALGHVGLDFENPRLERLRRALAQCESVMQTDLHEYNARFGLERRTAVLNAAGAMGATILSAFTALFAVLGLWLRKPPPAAGASADDGSSFPTAAAALVGALFGLVVGVWQVALTGNGAVQSSRYSAQYAHVRRTYDSVQRALSELDSCAADIAGDDANGHALVDELPTLFDNDDSTSPTALTEAWRQMCPRSPAAVWLPQQHGIATESQRLEAPELVQVYLAPTAVIALAADRARDECVLDGAASGEAGNR